MQRVTAAVIIVLLAIIAAVQVSNWVVENDKRHEERRHQRLVEYNRAADAANAESERLSALEAELERLPDEPENARGRSDLQRRIAEQRERRDQAMQEVQRIERREI
jgi:hypothetical protein